MKTLVKSLALALSLGFITSVASFAETNPIGRSAATFKTGIHSTQNGALQIALDKTKGSSVDIRLKSGDGRVLYSQHLGKKAQTYRTSWNLNELEDGVYQVEITNGVETTNQFVTISTQQPTTPGRVIAIN